MKKIRYRLLAMRLTQENLETAERERFSFVESNYILLYTRSGRKLPCGAVELPADTRLSAEEQAWLNASNLTVMDEFAARYREDAEDFLNRFERELTVEWEKIRESREPDDGGGVPCN